MRKYFKLFKYECCNFKKYFEDFGPMMGVLAEGIGNSIRQLLDNYYNASSLKMKLSNKS